MGGDLPLTEREKGLFRSAAERRGELSERTDAYRVVNGAGDRLPGWTLDRFGDRWQLQVFDSEVWDRRLRWGEEIEREFSPRALVFKRRTDRDGASLDRFQPEWWSGEGEGRTVVTEAGARFAVDVGEGVNPGLFLDMRHHRIALATHLRGKTLLNLFAYTGSFGVHARLAGAAGVTQVDTSGKILRQARLNLWLNGFRTGPGELSRRDAREYLAWGEKKGIRFDAVVIDPPTFAQHKGKTFRVERDLGGMIDRALSVLNPDGILLIGTNCSSLSLPQLRERIEERIAASRRRSVPLFSGGQDLDFPPFPGGRESHLAVVAVAVR